MIASRLRSIKFQPQRLVRYMGGGGDHHGPLMPPFARLRPPSKSLPEEIELVWDDTVAPETCVDLDAPHVASGDVLKHFFLGFSCFALLYTFLKASEPEKRSPVASRASVVNMDAHRAEVGLGEYTEEEHAHDEDEE